MLRNTRYGIILFALGGWIVLASLAAAAPLPIQLSTHANWTKYEFDPGDPTPDLADVDGNSTYDFKASQNGTPAPTAVVEDGMLKMTSSAGGDNDYYSIDPNEIWDVLDVTKASGHTIEVRARVHSETGSVSAFCVNGSGDGAGFSWLQVGLNDVEWGVTSLTTLADGLDNSQWAVYRIAQAPGEETYYAWRNGFLIGDELGAGYANTSYDRLLFGDQAYRDGGSFDFDSVRFATGAFGAVVPEPSTLLVWGLLGAAGGVLTVRRRRSRA